KATKSLRAVRLSTKLLMESPSVIFLTLATEGSCSSIRDSSIPLSNFCVEPTWLRILCGCPHPSAEGWTSTKKEHSVPCPSSQYLTNLYPPTWALLVHFGAKSLLCAEMGIPFVPVFPPSGESAILLCHKSSTTQSSWTTVLASGGGSMKRVVASVFIFLLLSESGAFAGLGGDKTAYMGGTENQIKEGTEGYSSGK